MKLFLTIFLQSPTMSLIIALKKSIVFAGVDHKFMMQKYIYSACVCAQGLVWKTV